MAAEARRKALEWMYGDETVVTLILTVFSVGIALGSMLCEKLSGRKVEIGLVPFGSFGLTVFGLLLWWHSGGFPQNVQANDWLAVLSYGQAWWVLFDINCLLSISTSTRTRTSTRMRKSTIKITSAIRSTSQTREGARAQVQAARAQLAATQAQLINSDTG